MGRIKTTSELEIIAGSTLDVDSSGALQINSSAAAISIGNDAVAQAINIGTAGARTITIGNTTGATAINLNIGTGDFTMASASGTLISQLDTGEMTRPLQPAFSAVQDTTATNATGAGTVATFGATTALVEIFDQGSDFTTAGVFTAPVTGRYFLTAAIRFTPVTAAMTKSTITFVTSNRNYLGSFNLATARDATNFCSQSITVLADMDAADTATLTLLVENGAGNTVGFQGVTAPLTRCWIQGYLVC